MVVARITRGKVILVKVLVEKIETQELVQLIY